MKKKLTLLFCILLPAAALVCLASALLLFSPSSREKRQYRDFSAWCREVEEKYGAFGLLITDPAGGSVEFSYNDSMLFSERYCPGSLLKPFIIISRGRDGFLDKKKRYSCFGYEDPYCRCWLGDGHGTLNLTRALAHSCNSYYYQYARAGLSRAAFVQVLSDYNLKLFGSNFAMSDDDFYNTAVGLGLSYTIHPARMLYAYNAFFNGGALYNTHGELLHTIQEKPEILECIRQGMMEGYHYGTGKLIFDTTGIADISAKTGTGSIITASGRYDWRKHMGWVILMYPSYNPRVSMLLVMEKKESSLVCETASELLNYLKENSRLFLADN